MVLIDQKQTWEKTEPYFRSAIFFLIGFVLPIFMAFANKSAPVFVVAAALVAGASIFLTGNAQRARQDLRTLFSSNLAYGTLAFALLAVASLAWTVDRAQTFRTLLEVTPVLLSGVIILIALYRSAQPVSAFWLAAGLFVAAIVLDIETVSHMALHRLVHARDDIAGLKGSSDVIPTLFWPAAFWLYHRTRDASALSKILLYGFGLTCFVSVLYAGGGTAKFGFVAGLVTFVLAYFWPRVTLGVVAALGLFLLAIAPFAGRVGNDLVSSRIQTDFDQANMHASERFLIWEAYGANVGVHPLLGHGLSVTRLIYSADPDGAGVRVRFGSKVAYTFRPRNPDVLHWAVTGKDGDRDVPHPHNAFLQIWMELGLVGALMAAILFGLVLKRITSLPEQRIPIALAMVATILEIACVGFGLWQAWWIATVFCAVIWFRLVGETTSKE